MSKIAYAIGSCIEAFAIWAVVLPSLKFIKAWIKDFVSIIASNFLYQKAKQLQVAQTFYLS